MKTIFTLIALPITILISIICFLFVLVVFFFESDIKEKNGLATFKRIQIESRNMSLIDGWESIHPVAQVIISVAIYYVIFF